MTRTIDFDAFRAERESEPVVLTIGGKKYDLPPSLPAVLAVDLIRMRADASDEADVPVEKLDEVGRNVFGDSVWESILREHRVGVEELPDLIKLVLEAYTAKPEDPSTASA